MRGDAGVAVTLRSVDAISLESVRLLPPTVTLLKLRADLAGDMDAAQLRRHCNCRLLYSLRSKQSGGASDAPAGERHRRLLAAAKEFDLIELEAERDLEPRLLDAIAPERRLVSWRGRAAGAPALARTLAKMTDVRAALYLIVTNASHFADTIAPLHCLNALHRRDVVAYDATPAGFWTRVIAPRFGAPLIFLNDGDEAGDLSSVATTIEDYDLSALAPVQTLFGIVGRSVMRSLSPRLHNARYREDGRAALFVPLPAVEFSDVRDAVAAAKDLAQLGLNLRGLTVTAPFKEDALTFAKRRSRAAVSAGAANLLVLRKGVWHADTTDPEGVLDALAHRQIPLRAVAAAVIGCGGAGRAVADALSQAGARVTLINRSMTAGRRAAQRLGLPFVPLSQFRPAHYRLVVNATPVGSDGVSSVVDVSALDAAAVVVDLTYGREVTPLVAAARARGLTIVDGLEVLSHQVRHQYDRMAHAESGEPGPDARRQARESHAYGGRALLSTGYP